MDRWVSSNWLHWFPSARPWPMCENRRVNQRLPPIGDVTDGYARIAREEFFGEQKGREAYQKTTSATILGSYVTGFQNAAGFLDQVTKAIAMERKASQQPRTPRNQIMPRAMKDPLDYRSSASHNSNSNQQRAQNAEENSGGWSQEASTPYPAYGSNR